LTAVIDADEMQCRRYCLPGTEVDSTGLWVAAPAPTQTPAPTPEQNQGWVLYIFGLILG